MENNIVPVPEAPIRRMLEKISPGSVLGGIQLFTGDQAGDHSNETFFVDFVQADGIRRRVAVKRYTTIVGHYASKAWVEFNTLAFLEQSHVPALKPVFVDGDGALFGAPAIVTEFAPGKKVMFPDLPQDVLRWGQEMGEVLARIHTLPCGQV